ncbi:hypothetical protein OIU84_018273 [Salix udensis]|uniref:Uncharacterized protein n=1 Tax=Salix udensis TaxID=889485 RepID=A0AAD6KXZ0_9ROSI|nr:hypothetical protein OIU84_018273 [Salix udensis]
MSFFVYATFAVLLDRISARAQRGLTHILGAAAFGQQLLMFHLHSTDHAGLEGQYHLLLQTVVVVSLTTTLMGIGLPKSFLGCLLYNDDGHKIVRCSGEEALHRAKSLANIQFGWLVIGITIFAVTLYLGLVEKHSKGGEYSSVLSKEFEETREESSDVESLREKQSRGHQEFACGKRLYPLLTWKGRRCKRLNSES